MDNLHMELMAELKKEHEKAADADKYCNWWREECKKTEQYEQQQQQDGDNLIKLAKYIDDKDSEIAALKAEIARLNELDNPHNTEFSADMDMVCDIPMKA